jgi:hypothetical protein
VHALDVIVGEQPDRLERIEQVAVAAGTLRRCTGTTAWLAPAGSRHVDAINPNSSSRSSREKA